jgi:adenine-specific DNA-methyltransferase
MVRALEETPPLVEPDLVAALLNSRVLDAVFRCVNGSTAVSAYELEALPLPPPEALSDLRDLVRDHADKETIERAIEEIYAGEHAKAAA